jgi:hypothetical protein
MSSESAESAESRHERRGHRCGHTPVSFYPLEESIERFCAPTQKSLLDNAIGAISDAKVVTDVVTDRVRAAVSVPGPPWKRQVDA